MSLKRFISCFAVITCGAWAQFPKIPGMPPGIPGMDGMEKMLGAVAGDVQKCMSEAGASLPDPSKGFPSPENMSPEDLCFTKCMGQSIGVISGEGDILVEQAKQFAPPGMDAAAVKEIEACLKKIGKINKCEDMAKMFACSPNKP